MHAYVRIFTHTLSKTNLKHLIVSLSSDTDVLIIKTKDGSKRVACTTFGPGDTISYSTCSFSLMYP